MNKNHVVYALTLFLVWGLFGNSFASAEYSMTHGPAMIHFKGGLLALVRTNDDRMQFVTHDGNLLSSGGFRKGLAPDTGEEISAPVCFRLGQNYPNPFNPETTIDYYLPQSAETELIIYNLQGQEVRRLVNKTQAAGVFTVQWDGRDAFGQSVASGTYLYRIHARTSTGVFSETKKMNRLK